MENNKVLFHTLVAHGKDSEENYAHHFSNQLHSLCSSIGVYKTGRTYFGRHGYSLRLAGLEKDFNDKALQRSIIMHSAWYVCDKFAKKYGRLGRIWG